MESNAEQYQPGPAMELFGTHMADAGCSPAHLFKALLDTKQLGKGFFAATVQTRRRSMHEPAVGSAVCRAALPPTLPGVGEQVARRLPASVRSDVIYVPRNEVGPASRLGLPKWAFNSRRHVCLVLLEVGSLEVELIRYGPNFDPPQTKSDVQWWETTVTDVKLREIALLLLASKGMRAPTSVEEASKVEALVVDVAGALRGLAQNKQEEYQRWWIMQLWGVPSAREGVGLFHLLSTPWHGLLGALDLLPETAAAVRSLCADLAAEEDDEEEEDSIAALLFDVRMDCKVEGILTESGLAWIQCQEARDKQCTERTTADEPRPAPEQREEDAQRFAASQATVEIEAEIAQANAAARQRKEAAKRNHKKLQAQNAMASGVTPAAVQPTAAPTERPLPKKTSHGNPKASKGTRTHQPSSADLAASREMWKLRSLARRHLDTAPDLEISEPKAAAPKRSRKAPQGDARLARRMAAAELLDAHR